jgi:hypothetical protein
MSVPLIQDQRPGYFINISVTTPIVSALKNYYIQSFLEVPAGLKALLDPGGNFTSETAARRFQK